MARRPLITTIGQLREAFADLPDRTVLLVAVGPARGPHFRWSDVRLGPAGTLSVNLRVTPFEDAPAEEAERYTKRRVRK